MTAVTHEHFEQLAVGHALSALEPEDEQLFLAHLSSCAACEHALAEHDETLSHLAYAPDATEPPPELLAGIRAGVLASGRPVSFPDAGPAAARPRPLRALGRQRDGRPPARIGHGGPALRRRLPLLAAAAAAAVLVGGLGTWNANLRNDRVTQSAQSEQYAAAVRTLFDAGPGRSVQLRDGSNKVKAVAVVRDNSVSLVTNDVEPTDAKNRYVLWREDQRGALHGVAAFDVRHRGVEVVRDLPLDVEPADVQYLLVTREPRGKGMPQQPTTTPLASGHVL